MNTFRSNLFYGCTVSPIFISRITDIELIYWRWTFYRMSPQNTFGYHDSIPWTPQTPTLVPQIDGIHWPFGRFSIFFPAGFFFPVFRKGVRLTNENVGHHVARGPLFPWVLLFFTRSDLDLRPARSDLVIKYRTERTPFLIPLSRDPSCWIAPKTLLAP